MRSRHLYFNGVDGETGRYLFPPTTPRQLAALAQSEAADHGEVAKLERWLEQVGSRRLLWQPHHPWELAEAGWGILFAADDPTMPAVREALGELLAHRCAQAARVNDRHYQEFAGERGYRRGESKHEFLARHGAVHGAEGLERMPHYLLIVGDPESIPFRFQSDLDVQYAVGRICFDTPAEYAAYARTVVAAETSPPLRRRRAVLFAPLHPGDAATGLSAGDLAAPLAARLTRHRPAWEVATAFGPQATKARLVALLGGEEEAALVFTAGHGVGYPSGHPLQRGRQGALLCQDFPRPGRGNGRVPPEHCFAADDVSSAARLHGLVTFHFACYSAGAPALGDFPHAAGGPLPRVAPRAFLSQLAQRLVGHPRGGALAVIGHAEKAWQVAIGWPGAGRSMPAFVEAFDRLLAGRPVGYAMATFGERYAELSADFAAELELVRAGAPLDEQTLSRLWTGRNDYRNYLVIGDPAVRLAIEARPEEAMTFGLSGGEVVH